MCVEGVTVCLPQQNGGPLTGQDSLRFPGFTAQRSTTRDTARPHVRDGRGAVGKAPATATRREGDSLLCGFPGPVAKSKRGLDVPTAVAQSVRPDRP